MGLLICSTLLYGPPNQNYTSCKDSLPKFQAAKSLCGPSVHEQATISYLTTHISARQAKQVAIHILCLTGTAFVHNGTGWSCIPLLGGHFAILKRELDQHAVTIKQMIHSLECSRAIPDVVTMQPGGKCTTDLQKQCFHLTQNPLSTKHTFLSYMNSTSLVIMVQAIMQ